MNRSPAFQFYPDKAHAGTIHLSPDAFKAYWMVVWWMWMHSRSQYSMPDTDAAWREATLITSPAKLKKVRAEIMEKGVWVEPSQYDPAGNPITKKLIEDGRNYLILDRATLQVGCPVHILHGRDDPDVPLALSLELVSRLAHDDVTLSIVHDGDHRLSRPEDIDLLIRTVADMVEAVGG